MGRGYIRMKTARFALPIIIAGLLAVACNNPNTETVRPSDQGQPATGASPTAAPSAAADELASARNSFKQHCSKCHGENGAGGIVDVDGKQLKIPNLTGEHARKPSDEKLAAKISKGDDEMPSFKDKLSEQEIQDLVRFIRKDFQAGK